MFLLRCNQRFFGQEHFERGTDVREFCTNLRVLKPVMNQYGFAFKDSLPQLPSDVGGIVQVKYNGMLSVIMRDDLRDSFVAWNPRGRCYYSLPDRGHPVTDYFNQHMDECRDHVFVGETYVVREIEDRCFMTEFNKSMSIIKNPKTVRDVERIRLAVFDYAKIKDGFTRPFERYIDRFEDLKNLGFSIGCDSDVVHLPDYLTIDGSFDESRGYIQGFWDEYIGERGFEGLVMNTNHSESYKIKFRDTLDVVILAFRLAGEGRPECEICEAKFDAFWLRKYSRGGLIERSEWFEEKGRLKGAKGSDIWIKDIVVCPLCGGKITKTAGPILGAKIALMTSNGKFLDVADGAQISSISPILDLLEPIYEDEGYLWVKPSIVIEVSYQQLYIDSPRPVYRFDNERYIKEGIMEAVSLRPYGPRHREDKTVNPQDLRLEQVDYFVKKIKSIQNRWKP